MKSHKIKLTNLAALLLTNALAHNSPWKRDLRDTAVACQLLVSTFGFVEAPRKDDPARGSWDHVTREYELSDREHETIKLCIDKVGSAIPAGKPALELITTFGLLPKE